MNTRGYCAIPSLFDTADQRRMIHLMDAHWESRGRPSLAGFGLGIHPILEHIPELAEYYAHPEVLAALRAILRDEPHLVHTGARLSSEESSDNIGWHEHYAWDKAGLAKRDYPERVLFGCYVRGTTGDVGPLVVMPRAVNDPIVPRGDSHKDWPGQVVVEVPPGSVIIFDTALYHTAHRGTSPGRRYLWGSHVQGWGNPKPHPEDNTANNATLRALKVKNPVLRRFLDRE